MITTESILNDRLRFIITTSYFVNPRLKPKVNVLD